MEAKENRVQEKWKQSSIGLKYTKRKIAKNVSSGFCKAIWGVNVPWKYEEGIRHLVQKWVQFVLPLDSGLYNYNPCVYSTMSKNQLKSYLFINGAKPTYTCNNLIHKTSV